MPEIAQESDPPPTLIDNTNEGATAAAPPFRAPVVSPAAPSLLMGLPSQGQTLGDFHLLALLGQGGQGRIFLASQLSLADRPVVLKISGRRGDEHLSLARLQHTHIVPLLSASDEPDRQ